MNHCLFLQFCEKVYFDFPLSIFTLHYSRILIFSPTFFVNFSIKFSIVEIIKILILEKNSLIFKVLLKNHKN